MVKTKGGNMVQYQYDRGELLFIYLLIYVFRKKNEISDPYLFEIYLRCANSTTDKF